MLLFAFRKPVPVSSVACCLLPFAPGTFFFARFLVVLFLRLVYYFILFFFSCSHPSPTVLPPPSNPECQHCTSTGVFLLLFGRTLPKGTAAGAFPESREVASGRRLSAAKCTALCSFSESWSSGFGIAFFSASAVAALFGVGTSSSPVCSCSPTSSLWSRALCAKEGPGGGGEDGRFVGFLTGRAK